MKRALSLMTAALACLASHGEIVINEIMQSNIDCVVDDLNQYPDSWVEIYNAGTSAVDLGAYSVGNTEDSATAWQLPSAIIEPGAYRLIYCDKEASGWHTPFRLESGKDCAFFIFKDGAIVDQLPKGMKKQPAPNVAYGRVTDGVSNWAYQLEPTPGRANTGRTCGVKDILGAPVFSPQGMVLSGGDIFRVTLDKPDGTPDGVVIRYTTDGSEPTTNSPVYTDPILIDESMVVRAKLFADGYLSPRSTAHSYIFHDRDITLPVISIATENANLYDDKFGILVEGTYSGGDQKNYQYDWRRPMNFEIFDGDYTASCINQLGEARVAGAASRSAQVKTLAIYANKRFGEKRFKHEFFPDQRPGLTDYKSLMLRNAGNDFDYLYMRDAIIQRHMAQYVDIDWQAWSPAIVYINGKYMGMLNIRERSNEDNIYTNYAGLEDIDMVENMWELKEGDIQEWYDFQAFYNEHGHTYAEYNERMDVREFIDVMILNLYYCNLDFPGNNIVHWKPRGEGGRWRVLVKDTDFGLGLYGRDANYQVFRWLYDPNYDPDSNWAVQYDHTRLFRRLMEDARFHDEFIDRFAVYMGDFMNFDRTWETWEPMYERIRYEYPYHRALINQWWPNYDNEIDGAKCWLKARTDNMYTQIDEFYNVGTPVALKVDIAEESEGAIESVAFNGINLSRRTFNGKYFAGRQFTLTAPGADRWAVTVYSAEGVTRTFVNGAQLTYTLADNVSKVEIVAISGNAEVPEPNTDKILFEGEAEIDWWENSLTFGPETFDDFKAAESIVMKAALTPGSQSATFRFQAIGHDWSQTSLPSQWLVEGAWSNPDKPDKPKIELYADGEVVIPLNQADKDLIDPERSQLIMLAGVNLIVKEVRLQMYKSTGVESVVTDRDDTPTYNLMGIPVDDSYRGIVIKNGRKILRR